MKLGRIAVLIAFIFLGCARSPSAGAVSEEAVESAKALAPKIECPLAFPTYGLCASFTWDKPATEEETGEGTVRFWSATEGSSSGPFVNPPLTVGVKLWMASMGHGSTPVKVTPATESSGAEITGVFKAREIYFSMPGDWEVWVQLKTGKQVNEQAKFDIKI